MLVVTLSPAWFQTPWFLLLCIACGGALVLLLYKLRLRQVAAGIHQRFEERLAERTRIAQELHDTLLQGFLSASMQVHVAASQLPADSPVKATLSRALDLMRRVIDEGRSAVFGLRSSRSLSLDLESAFAGIQDEVQTGQPEESRAEFRIIIEGSERALNPLLRDEVYRIGREALANAFRHARARHVETVIEYGARDFLLSVSDDGRGMSPDVLRTGREGHWGLAGMRERAARLGARLQISSSLTSGTEVVLSVPGHIIYEDEPRHWLQRLRWRAGFGRPIVRTDGRVDEAAKSE